jgi:hypothetical protein
MENDCSLSRNGNKQRWLGPSRNPSEGGRGQQTVIGRGRVERKSDKWRISIQINMS